MSQTPTTDQELWITLRFKGCADIEDDEQLVARRLLSHLENLLARPRPTLADRLLSILEFNKLRHGFTLCHPGDVMDIETEAEIYGLNEEEAPKAACKTVYTVTLDQIGRYHLLVHARGPDEAEEIATTAMDAGTANITFCDDEITIVDVREYAAAPTLRPASREFSDRPG